MLTVKDVIAAMERIAPPALALPGDPVGLHAGSRRRPVARLAVALDADIPAVERAAERKIDMLVVHHPRFYKGLSTLSADDPSGRRAALIVGAGLAVYSAHTNLDLAPGGVNDVLARIVGLVDPVVVRPEINERLLKLAVFVPASHIDKVTRAVCGAGAGAIGKYLDCTFRVRGTGTFRADKDARPFIGKPGAAAEADEFRLETVFGEFMADRILSAMLRAHPYEEVAYDLHPLLDRSRPFGFGRAGALGKPETLAGLAERAARATRSRMTQFTGRPAMKVRRAATWGGGGVDAKAVLDADVDALVAGEISYHDLEAFTDNGVGVVTLGHSHSEAAVLGPLAARLRRELPGLPVTVIAAAGAAPRNIA